ncbi:MAG: hypothetical protein ACI4OT_04770, partial [Bacilli bacterium]
YLFIRVYFINLPTLETLSLKDYYLINLTGHGSIMMSKKPEQLKNIEIIGRKLPERIYIK